MSLGSSAFSIFKVIPPRTDALLLIEFRQRDLSLTAVSYLHFFLASSLLKVTYTSTGTYVLDVSEVTSSFSSLMHNLNSEADFCKPNLLINSLTTLNVKGIAWGSSSAIVWAINSRCLSFSFAIARTSSPLFLTIETKTTSPNLLKWRWYIWTQYQRMSFSSTTVCWKGN